MDRTISYTTSWNITCFKPCHYIPGVNSLSNWIAAAFCIPDVTWPQAYAPPPAYAPGYAYPPQAPGIPGEALIGVIPNASRKKGLFSTEAFNIVVTNQCMIFA